MDDNKRCRVCGDKALCFNFNGLSCEACKVFFRRNLIKNEKFECKNETNCMTMMQKSTRKFCKRCRMDKCFAIGMKKELITIFKEKATLQNIPTDVSDYNQELQPYDLLRINEIEKAMIHFPNEHNLPSVGLTEDQAYLANLTEHYARRSIKFCKSIEAFRSLDSMDQYKLMKSFFPEITAIQMSFIYMEEKDYVRVLNETGQGTVYVSVDGPADKSMVAKEYGSRFRRFAFPLRFIMQNDTTIRNLLFAHLLFKPRDNTSCQEFVNFNYAVYSRLLRKYLRFKFKSTGDKTFSSLMDVLGQIGVTSKIYWNFYDQEFTPNELHELVRDIYDIKLV